MKLLTVEVPDGAYSLEATAVFAGDDLSVTICGGEKHHIGAAATSIARPSLADSAKPSSSTSVYCVLGHKEDELAKSAASKLAAEFNCVVNVCAGIHIDNASAGDIDRLMRNFSELTALLMKKIRQSL